MSHPPLMLDSGPLAQLVHPKLGPDLAKWFLSATAAGQRIVIPEIADYELRRKLLHQDFRQSLSRLDSLEAMLGYLKIDTAILRRAAELWAAARRRGHPAGLMDLIKSAGACVAVVASENTGSHYVNSAPRRKDWHANIVFTLHRRGDKFSLFFKRLFAAMFNGTSMLMAWVELAPQGPGPWSDDLPETYMAIAGHIIFDSQDARRSPLPTPRPRRLKPP